MISFDDVAKTLTHPEDVVAYGMGDAGFGRANGAFLSRLYASTSPAAPTSSGTTSSTSQSIR